MLSFKNTLNFAQNGFPKVSIVILNFNGQQFVKRCLSSLFSIDYPSYEVLFVDNCSTDDSLATVQTEFGHVLNMKILELDKNLGYSAGNNFGTQYADKDSKYLLFLNVDVEVTSNFLTELIKIMEQNPQVGAAQPKLMLMQNRNNIDSFGALIDVIGTVHSIGERKTDNGQYAQIKDVFYAKGAALIIPKQLFEKLEQFDECFFLWRDEVDLCWRIWLHGLKVVSIPTSVVFHYGSAIIKKNVSNPKMEFFFTRNNIRMLIKNYSLKSLVKYLPMFLVFRTFTTFHNMFSSRNPLHMVLFCKSIVWNLFHLKRTLLKRYYVQKKIRRVKDDKIIGNVMTQHLFLIKGLKVPLVQLRVFPAKRNNKTNHN